ERRLRILGHPLVLAACLLAVAGIVGVRQQRGARREADQAVGWLLEGRASVVSRVRPGFFKTDMLIRPAVRVVPKRTAPAVLELPDVPLGDVLRGWVAIDDDAAKVRGRGSHRLRVEARPGGERSDDAWTPLAELAVAHHPGLRQLEVPSGELA